MESWMMRSVLMRVRAALVRPQDERISPNRASAILQDSIVSLGWHSWQGSQEGAGGSRAYGRSIVNRKYRKKSGQQVDDSV